MLAIRYDDTRHEIEVETEIDARVTEDARMVDVEKDISMSRVICIRAQRFVPSAR